MNKKKIITSAAILTSGILLFNPLNVKATICTGTYTYYFSEATSIAEAGARDSVYETCFTIEGARLRSMDGSTASTMTVNDCERYMEASRERENSGLSYGDEYCDVFGNCLNSGVENSGGNFDKGFVDYTGGCKNFINDFSIDSDATISSDVSSAVANECKNRGGIAIAINRDYTYTNKNASNMYRDENGNKWNFIPNVINATFTFEVDGECPNAPKTTDDVCVSPTGDRKITMGCNGNASANGKYSKSLDGTKYVDIKHNTDANTICTGTKKAVVNSKSSGNFYETGYGQASFGNANYAGGGAKITFNFNTTSTWRWCESDGNHAKCERKEISVCPSEYTYNSSTKKCEKEIDDSKTKTGVEEKDCQGANQSYEKSTKVCTTTTSTTVTEEPCTTYDTFKCDDEDIKLADDIAFENAGKESKAMSANGTATSRDSNDEKDTTMYRIEKGGADTGHEAGKFTSVGGGGGSWEVGTSRSGSVSFGIYNSCIGIYNPFKVRYDEGGQCTDLEIEGGNKYYIPLKAKTGTFPFEATVDDVSILTGIRWNLEVSCGIEFTQKMFGSDESGGKKYDYRPIDMSNPFPKSSGKIEKMPSNWQLFMSKSDLVNKYMNRENVEYIGNLTLEDITAIKQKSNATPYKYSDLKSITPEGKSSLLDTFNGVTREENNYNNLGKCEKDCW